VSDGLYQAKLEGEPVLAITSMPYHDLIGTHTQQDVQLDKVFADVAEYKCAVSVWAIPTDGPESDAKLEWTWTTTVSPAAAAENDA
jgi:thiamine pyrophosphate-dependent acetolactate synthase large subunit-like protein